jgi:hypothetical protein
MLLRFLCGTRFAGWASFSENDENRPTQPLSTPSPRHQCGDDTLQMLVTPGSLFRPSTADYDDGMFHRAIARYPSATPIII